MAANLLAAPAARRKPPALLVRAFLLVLLVLLVLWIEFGNKKSKKIGKKSKKIGKKIDACGGPIAKNTFCGLENRAQTSGRAGAQGANLRVYLYALFYLHYLFP